MKKFLMLTILAVMLSVPAYAGSFDDGNGENIRDYYLSFGLGTSFNKYNDEPMGEDSSADKTSIFLDLSFYVPMDKNLLIGATISGAADRFSDPDSNDYYQVNTYLLGGSALYFLDYIEEGLFFRGDLGFSKMAVSYDINGHSDSEATDQWGLGILGGVGYSLPFETFSLTGSLLFSHKQILDSNQNEDLTVSTVSLSLGALF